MNRELQHILVVEDDPQVAGLIDMTLKRGGYQTTLHDNLQAGELTLLGDTRLDAAILDIQLPDGTGWELLAKARRAHISTPILILSGMSSTEDRVRGLDMGADDYVTKPFSTRELLARVSRAIERAQGVLSLGDLRLEPASRRVWVSEQLMDLTTKEYSVLFELIHARGAVVSKAQLLLDVWGLERDPGTTVVEALVARLRTKVGAERIENVPRQGYRIPVAEPQDSGESAPGA